MFPTTTIYQRTLAGRDEIHDKRAGLTQSERQVLIMVDGVTPNEGILAKLSALKGERVERAMRTLLKKELISEVFLPVAGQEPERIAEDVVDRFLRQEETDPVTVISYDPEEDFGDLPVQSIEEPVAPIPELDVVVAPEPAVDAAHALMVDTLQQELQARQTARPRAEPAVSPEPAKLVGAPATPAPPPAAAVPPAKAHRWTEHWAYWSIGLGLSFIIGFVIARLIPR